MRGARFTTPPITSSDMLNRRTDSATNVVPLPSCVPEGSARSQSRLELWRRAIRWSRPALLWRGFLREVRSLSHRMGNLDTLGSVRFGGRRSLAGSTHPDPHHPFCNQITACIRDTKTFFAHQSWATPWDLQLFVWGWELGAKSVSIPSGECTCHLYRKCTSCSNSASAHSVGEDSTLPPTVQQSTKRGPSAPLP